MNQSQTDGRDDATDMLFDLDGPTIIRMYKDRANPYVMINRRVLEDDRLSWAARGVMAYLLAKPDNWEVRPRDLQRQGGCGRDAIRSIFSELEEHGYLWRHKVNGGGGKFTWVHRVYESPDLNPRFRTPLKSVQDAPKLEKPSPEKPSMVKPSPEKPSVDRPATAGPATAQPEVVQPATGNTSPYMNNQVPITQVPITQVQQNTHNNNSSNGAATPAPGGLCVGSRFSLEECKRYAEHLRSTGQGITNPGGFAVKIFRTGECDAQIERFLHRTEIETTSPSTPILSIDDPPTAKWRPLWYSELQRLRDAEPDRFYQGDWSLLIATIGSMTYEELRAGVRKLLEEQKLRREQLSQSA